MSFASFISTCPSGYPRPALGQSPLLRDCVFQARDRVIAIEQIDDARGNVCRANRLAFEVVGAVAEPFIVHLSDHPEHTIRTLRLALGQMCEVANLRADEKHSAAIRTRGD